MFIIRHLAIVLFLATSVTAGCVLDDGIEEEGEEEIGSSEAAIEATPMCKTVVDEQSEWQACGLKPNGMPAHELCTRTCTTHKEMHWNTIPATCEVGPTLCTQWICGPCND